MQRYFKEEEIINEIRRFVPNSYLLSTIEDNDVRSATILEIKDKASLLVAIDFKNYLNNYTYGKKLSDFIVDASNAISQVEADIQKHGDYLFIQKLESPEYNSIIMSNKEFTKKSMSNRVGITVFSLLLDGKVLENKAISLLSKSVPANESYLNSLCTSSYEFYAIDVPILRSDINLKDESINEINYNN